MKTTIVNTEGRISNNWISALNEDEIFVFGSNLEGKHMGGAARIAHDHFGAQWGQGEGLQGQSYAIPTMHGNPDAIRPYVCKFIQFAEKHPEYNFLVTKIGCGIAGLDEKEMALLFIDAIDVKNIFLPKLFYNIVNQFWVDAREARSELNLYEKECIKFIDALDILHKKGYERLRLCPQLSPTGMAWRGFIVPRKYTLKMCYADFQNADQAIHHEDCFCDRLSPDGIANQILIKYPEICCLGLGKEPEYLSWYKVILNATRRGAIPFAIAKSYYAASEGYIRTSTDENLPLPPAGEFEFQ